MRCVLALATAAAALGALAASAAATIVLRVSPRELADRAGLVVEGRVATVDVRWDAGRTGIFTYAVVNVERTHKGVNSGSVTVKVPGGRVGNEELRVDGTARFEAGEECFLFLWKDRDGEWLVLGEAQGKFRLFRDAETGVRMAENSLKGLCLVVRPDPKKGASEAAARKADRLSRDDLASVVAASVAAGTPPAGGAGPSTGGAPMAPGAGTRDEGATGGVPAPQPAAPEPPSTTTPDGGAPPPTKDAPAPPAGSSGTADDGKPKPPAPETGKR